MNRLTQNILEYAGEIYKRKCLKIGLVLKFIGILIRYSNISNYNFSQVTFAIVATLIAIASSAPHEHTETVNIEPVKRDELTEHHSIHDQLLIYEQSPREQRVRRETIDQGWHSDFLKSFQKDLASLIHFIISHIIYR